MTKEEFEALLMKELENMPAAEEDPEDEETLEVETDSSLSLSKMDLIKMSIFLERAEMIIAKVGTGAAENHNLDVSTDCLMATAGLTMVRTKIMNPIMEAILKIDGEREENDEH